MPSVTYNANSINLSIEVEIWTATFFFENKYLAFQAYCSNSLVELKKYVLSLCL